ncbi:MAG: tail fiber domain-containing protein, partial [Bacteroidota bacterium]
RIILLIGVCLCSFQWLSAQVKIGDNPLDVGADRLLEIEENLNGAPEFIIVTDSLRFGRSSAANSYSPNTDALMLKLYGYGFGSFSTGLNTSPYIQRQETISSVDANVFMGITNEGELLEVPLTLDLDINSTTATLRMNNGNVTFGDVGLNPLDSIFATDADVTTLIDQSVAADGDTISGNEHIRTIDIVDSAALLGNSDPDIFMVITENTDPSLPVYDNTRSVNLGLVFTSDFELTDSLTTIRNEIADTAATLRGLIFYEIDGQFSSDRTAGGQNLYDLNFTELDSFNVDESNTIRLEANNDINITSLNDDVNITADEVNVDGVLNADSTVNFTAYGGTNTPGTESRLLGVTPTGEVVNVSLDSIGGDATLSSPVDLDEDGTLETTVDDAIQASNREIDSTIYIYDGTLTGARTMNMAGFDLTFRGNETTSSDSSVIVTRDGRMGIGTTAFTADPNPGETNVRLEVNGDILARQVFASSDARFKKNVTSVDGALDKVKAINGVNYDFKVGEFKGYDFPQTRQLGFIAQNLESVVPEVVITNADGYKAVDYAKLTALLNEAIKEQQAQIDNQNNVITAQQAMLETLMSQQASLAKEIASLRSQTEDVSNRDMSEE